MRVDTVNGGFSRSFRELTAVFHWLSGFTSKRRSGWRSLHLAAACVRCLLQFTSHFAYIIWFSPHNSRRRGDRWYHPLLTDAETDSEADLSRAIRLGWTPTQVFRLSAHPLTCHTDPIVGATRASRAVYGLFLWKAAWSRSSPFAFSFFLAQNVQHSGHQLLNRAANHRCLSQS